METPEYRAQKLAMLQAAMPELKVELAKRRIQDAYSHFGGQMYVSFSGGKDSTVLVDLVRNECGLTDVPIVFVDTGLEYPEVRSFALSIADEIVKPKMTFKAVIEKHGYPVVSKETSQKVRDVLTTGSDKLRNKRLHGDENGNGKIPAKWMFLLGAPFKISERCCNVLKKEPAKRYERQSKRVPFIGTMAADSRLRLQSFVRDGCNAFEGKRPQSRPMMTWTDDDVWHYIKTRKLDYSSIYDMGYKRTGCAFCAFGCHLNKDENKFQTMSKTHPQLWKYCMENLGMAEVCKFLGIETRGL